MASQAPEEKWQSYRAVTLLRLATDVRRGAREAGGVVPQDEEDCSPEGTENRYLVRLTQTQVRSCSVDASDGKEALRRAAEAEDPPANKWRCCKRAEAWLEEPWWKLG